MTEQEYSYKMFLASEVLGDENVIDKVNKHDITFLIDLTTHFDIWNEIPKGFTDFAYSRLNSILVDL